MRDLIPIEYEIRGYEDANGLAPRIVMRRGREGTKWAVVWKYYAIAKDGSWEWEPIPSSRTEEFLKRCRFASPEEALAVLLSSKDPDGPRRKL